MALELNKLTHEIDALGETLAARSTEFAAKVPAAQGALHAIGKADDELEAKIAQALGRWAGAIPTEEPVNATFAQPAHPARANVIAVDGSQVYPDRHGLALYYLINIGSIVFRHGLGSAPNCSSQPRVFFQTTDLYEGEQLIPSAVVDAKRDLGELAELATLAAQEVQSAPTLALLDNGLMWYIFLQIPNPRRAFDFLQNYLAELDRIRASGAGIAGIIDRPRAANVIRLLRLATLTTDEINDETLRAATPFERVPDSMLFDFLQPGERSALFVLASPENMEHYKPKGHQIYFFYVNTGRPGKNVVLRVEIPQWVVEDRALLDLVHAGVVEQSRVTNGFPYVLMRAHELAVVTTRERRDLDQMVISTMIRRGLSPEISHKAQGKAWTGGGKRRFR